ncbi:MAG TPA: class III signal peptide-containing protein [Methanobacterium sp.]|nr:MAG: class III signal peptide-containing protein [Methanobacterium sp.]HOI70836.1 class III signal peptide-containing protein [Methanobacterium sp.]HPX78014.1 class III signal peptide-containing protein [Methanobacterium sp.]
MSFFKDESGQGAAEYILLFGGIIIVAIAALYIYYQYFDGNPYNFADDDQIEVRQNVTSGNSG